MEAYTSDGLRLDVVDDGPRDGEVVVLLHGFPQDASAWEAVVPHLHAAGLRTLAPHQRGYCDGARPRRVADYRIERLVGDVVALLDAAGTERAHVVGHDWGGALAWAVAAAHPGRVATLVSVSTPHPDALVWAVRHAGQWRRSWYVLALQLPALPERALARMLRRGTLERSGLPREHALRYAARLARARDLRGPVNWYRALARRPSRGIGPVRVPATLVWGSRDPFLGRAAAERTARYVEADYRFVELRAGHWLPEREPEAVAREIVARIYSPA